MLNEKIDKILIDSMTAPLSFERAEKMFDSIMDGNASDIQIAAFLTALKVRGESIDEITAAASIMRKKSFKVLGAENAIDIVGTGGDGKSTLNISTATSLTVASSGMAVAKHGNRKISSLSGSSDALQSLGVNTQMSPKIAEQCFNNFNYCFMMAPIFHPAMKNVMPVRQELKTRTIFNILGPLTNPASVSYQLIGVYDNSVAKKVAEVLKNLKIKRAWIVHGDDGTDEISITEKTKVTEIDRGKIKSFNVHPKDAGLKTHAFKEIEGGSAEFNAKKIDQMADGERNGFLDSVLFNSAAALYISGSSNNLEEGVKTALESVCEGKTRKLINDLKTYSSGI